MSEEIPVELTEQDVADLHQLHSEPSAPEPQTFRPILLIWREVLAPAKDEMTAKVTATWANRIVSSYQEVQFADMEEFRTRYFTKLLHLASILEEEIDTDEDCLTYNEPAEDAEQNSHHYKNLLMYWQMTFLQWEMEWETTDIWAAVELAAISEIHKMFFGQTGITQFLDNIGFEYTEADQESMTAALNEFAGRASE